MMVLLLYRLLVQLRFYLNRPKRGKMTTPEKNFRYEINEDLELRIWDGLNDEPFMLQPFNCDNENKPWKDRDEVIAFAEKIINEVKETDKLVAEDPDYFKKLQEKKLSDYGHPVANNFDPVLTPEQRTLIEQAREDSERIKRIEQVLADILNKLN